MGMNLISACHCCKEKIFHLRRKESETMIPFYKRHEGCLRADSGNIVTLDDQYQYAGWMDDSSDYTTVDLP